MSRRKTARAGARGVRPPPPAETPPDHEAADLPPIVEIPPPQNVVVLQARARSLTGTTNHLLRTFVMGKATITMTRQAYLPGLHVSVARPDRLPSWNEVARVRYALMPKDRVCAMLLPPVEDYVNVNKNCFQILELPEDVGKELA